jgi:NAD+--asparagine ADP-ribosyltransferase
VAWAIEGHTAVSADNIITAISTSTKVKSHVNAQIAAAESDLENQMKNVKTALTKVGELAQIAYAKSIITLT